MSVISWPRPQFDNFQAALRAQAAVGHGTYQLGTGNIDTPVDGQMDCCGFATCYAYGIKRHRPGFNVGPWSTCSDDINCNSSIEDGLHAQDLFEVITEPQIGALLKYPTIHLVVEGQPRSWCGHEAIVVGTNRAIGKWNAAKPDYALLDVVQMCGPPGHHPGIIASDGAIWRHHDQQWPKPEHRSYMLKMKP